MDISKIENDLRPYVEQLRSLFINNNPEEVIKNTYFMVLMLEIYKIAHSYGYQIVCYMSHPKAANFYLRLPVDETFQHMRTEAGRFMYYLGVPPPDPN